MNSDERVFGEDLPSLDDDVRERRSKRRHPLLQRPVRDQLVDGGAAASVEDLVHEALHDDPRRLRSPLRAVHATTVRPRRSGSVRIA
jgi:hypothetical protein